jgi:predicted transcriptional regulator
MEDLLATFPQDFFPGKNFVLLGRQRVLAGVGRFDLIFEDNWNSTIVMELKARPLKYEDATQVANYRDELKRIGHKNVVMWLVAPQIPRSVRDFLDDKGIEYNEIHDAEFRRVAERHSFEIKGESERPTPQLTTKPVRRLPRASAMPTTEALRALGLREAHERLGPEWSVRDLAEALKVHKSNAHRRLKNWIHFGKVRKIADGKRGGNHRGGLAKYRFAEAISDEFGSKQRNREEEIEERMQSLMEKAQEGQPGTVTLPESVFFREVPDANPEEIKRILRRWREKARLRPNRGRFWQR